MLDDQGMGSGTLRRSITSRARASICAAVSYGSRPRRHLLLAAIANGVAKYFFNHARSIAIMAKGTKTHCLYKVGLSSRKKRRTHRCALFGVSSAQRQKFRMSADIARVRSGSRAILSSRSTAFSGLPGGHAHCRRGRGQDSRRTGAGPQARRRGSRRGTVPRCFRIAAATGPTVWPDAAG